MTIAKPFLNIYRLQLCLSILSFFILFLNRRIFRNLTYFYVDREKVMLKVREAIKKKMKNEPQQPNASSVIANNQNR